MDSNADAKENVLRAMLNISNSPTGSHNFNVIVEWLKSQETKCLEDSAKTRSTVDTRWLQGEARFIHRFLDMIENANSHYDMLKRLNGEG